ncbi:MAG: asparaginase [Mesorhizobium sp.]|nr:asparaginase [Mesorhizobium sp.]
MTNPILAEIRRGGVVESRHRGAIAVVDGDGGTLVSVGDVERPVFPRSAVKVIQALPLVESGASDRFGFGARELALACASHNGEPAHAELALSMLGRAELDETALECGTHWPSHQPALIELARKGNAPSALHNNCSGKHAGFVCACRHMGLDHRGYVKIGHDYQRIIAATMTQVTGASHAADNSGTDGCSIPTYAVPLTNLASGFARLATGQGLEPVRAAAARRLFAACMAEPFYVAGTARADTAMMQAAPGRVFVKIGAEGVYCGAVPELGLGFALKIDDGAGRAAEVAVAALLAELLKDDATLSATFGAMAEVTMTNWNGIDVGSVRAADGAPRD